MITSSIRLANTFFIQCLHKWQCIKPRDTIHPTELQSLFGKFQQTPADDCAWPNNRAWLGLKGVEHILNSSCNWGRMRRCYPYPAIIECQSGVTVVYAIHECCNSSFVFCCLRALVCPLCLLNCFGYNSKYWKLTWWLKLVHLNWKQIYDANENYNFPSITTQTT